MPEANSPKQELFGKIRDFMTDMLTVDVVTLTGELTVKVDDDIKVTKGGHDVIDFQKLHAKIVGQLGGEIKIAAFTHVGLDKDTVQFVMESSTQGESPLIDHHRATVKDVQEARAAFFNSIKGMIPNTVISIE